MKHFTLTDLVFTLTACLLLGSLVTVAATGSAAKADRTLCASNMKSLGEATFRYTADNKGYLPESGFMKDNWKRKIIPYLIGKDTADLKKAIPYFHCPADRNKLPSYMRNNPSYIGKNSFCANIYVIDIKGVDVNNDHVKNGQELKKLYGPDTIILFAEDHTKRNSIGQGPSVRFDKKGEYEYPEQAQAGYHGGKNNYLMLDGAVEFDKYENTVNPYFNKWITRFVYSLF